MKDRMKSIAYIFPIYNESGTIDELYKVITKTSKKLSAYKVSFIFINDGSRDDSLAKLRELSRKDERVTVIDFSRNYGHQLAVTAGIDHADADALVIMDSDLQDPPEVSLELIDKWEEGYDVVYAQRRSRKDTIFKRMTAFIYYHALHYLADIDIPRNTGDFRLIDRKVADELRKYREHSRFLRGLVSFIGFRQIAVPFDRNERYAGVTGYPFQKMVRFAADGIISFSSFPLRLISRLGYLISALSVLGIVYALTVKIIFPETVVEGWAFIVISIFFVGGVQLTMLGVIGNYIGRIYTEVQGRPLYGVKDIYTKAARQKKR